MLVQERSDIEDVGQTSGDKEDAVTEQVEKSTAKQGGEGEHVTLGNLGLITHFSFFEGETIGFSGTHGVKHS